MARKKSQNVTDDFTSDLISSLNKEHGSKVAYNLKTDEVDYSNTLVLQNKISPPYEGMLPAAGGDLIPWENGNFMVTWGFSGVLEEVDIEGERIWMYETAIQESLGFFGSTNLPFEN